MIVLPLGLCHLLSVNGHKTELEGYQKWLPLPVVFLELREYGVRPEEQEDDCADIYRLCCLWTQWEAFPVRCHTNEFAGKDSDSSDGSPATDFNHYLQNHLYLANTRAEVFSPAPETHCPAEFISSRSSVWLGLDLNSAGSGMKTWRIIPLSTLKGKMAPLNHSQSEEGQSDFSRAGLSSRNRRQAGSIGSCFPYFYFPQLMCLPLFA